MKAEAKYFSDRYSAEVLRLYGSGNPTGRSSTACTGLTEDSRVIQGVVAWQQGALIFKGETLQQAVKEISRYTHLQLIIVDPAIMQMRVGGHYKTNDIDSLLASLGRGFGIQIDRVGNNQIHLSASTSAAP